MPDPGLQQEAEQAFAVRTTDCEGGNAKRPGMPPSMGWNSDGSHDPWMVTCSVCGLLVGIEMSGGTTNEDSTVTYHAMGATMDASYRLKPHERTLTGTELNALLESRDQHIKSLMPYVQHKPGCGNLVDYRIVSDRPFCAANTLRHCDCGLAALLVEEKK